MTLGKQLIALRAARGWSQDELAARTGGIIFLCFGFAVILLLTLLSGALLESLVFSVPFFICAVLCFKLRGHAGLWCVWVFVLLIEFYLRYATGIRWLWLFRGISILHTLTAVGMLLAYLLMLFVTLRAYRDLRLSPTPKRKALLTFGWVLFAALYGLRWLPLSPDALMAIENLSRLLFPLRDGAPWLVLIPLSILTAGIIRTKK